MTNSEEEIEKKLKNAFPNGIEEIKIEKEHRIIVKVKIEILVEIANFLKHDLGFLIPNMCTGTDMKDYMDIVWHVGTQDSAILVILRVHADRDDCVVPALTPVWEGMNWHERETFDLLGVKFENHPDLRRILMPENWEGHPLREDYVYRKPTYRKPEDIP